ncbi:hypothetical protein NLX74_15945 [Paenibacillus sp. MZ03-122A]|nr:hypothetical protein [Paenibacillus sp. MZ03-122A]
MDDISELIINGKTSYLAAVGNKNEMARETISLLSNEQKYLEMRNAYVNKAHLNFSSDQITSHNEGIYNRVLETNRGASPGENLQRNVIHS